RLAEHPLVELGCLTSRQYAGKKASEVFGWVGNHSPLANLEFIEPGYIAAFSQHRLRLSCASAWCCIRVCGAVAGARDQSYRSERGFSIEGCGSVQVFLQARAYGARAIEEIGLRAS